MKKTLSYVHTDGRSATINLKANHMDSDFEQEVLDLLQGELPHQSKLVNEVCFEDALDIGCYYAFLAELSVPQQLLSRGDLDTVIEVESDFDLFYYQLSDRILLLYSKISQGMFFENLSANEFVDILLQLVFLDEEDITIYNRVFKIYMEVSQKTVE